MIKQALAGVEAVIQTLGVTPALSLIVSRTQLFSTATRVLVDAMENSPVKRLICVTDFGAGDSRGRGGLLYDAALGELDLGSEIFKHGMESFIRGFFKHV